MEAVLARSQSTRYPRTGGLVENFFSRNSPRSKSLGRPGAKAKGQVPSPMSTVAESHGWLGAAILLFLVPGWWLLIAWWRILSLDLISNYFRAFVDTLTHNSISPLLSFNGILSYLQADLLLRQEFWRIFIKRYPACSNAGVTFQTLHVTKCHEDKYFIISCQTGNVSFLLLKDLWFRTIEEFLFLLRLWASVVH